ncbi:hypothetical protein C5167_023421 [Papaver somniferum]|uniref:Uncharacterized protein n=1 Tax=Papaver somniferum TaxID=3469 RepID=A0A4Y7JLN0_PAPSO|nr:hypothetical protein C5167_023421 [Papaver somniferum]
MLSLKDKQISESDAFTFDDTDFVADIFNLVQLSSTNLAITKACGAMTKLCSKSSPNRQTRSIAVA